MESNGNSSSSNRAFGTLRMRGHCLGSGSGDESRGTCDGPSPSPSPSSVLTSPSLFRLRMPELLRDTDGSIKSRHGVHSNQAFEMLSGNSPASSPRPRFESPMHGGGDGLTMDSLRSKYYHPLASAATVDADFDDCCATLRPRCHVMDCGVPGLEGHFSNTMRSRTSSNSRNSSPLRSPQRLKLRNGDGIRYLVQSTYRSLVIDDVTEESFRCNNHSDHMMRKMELYFMKRQLCDVILVAGSRKIHAHRLLLSAASDYFLAMFTSNVREATEEEIIMKDIEPDALASLIKYIYTGLLDLRDETVESLMSTACILQLIEVVEACSYFLMKQLHPSNCIGIRHFADAQGCRELYRAANDYVVENFIEVTNNQEFLLLSSDDLTKILSSDDINVPNEETVFQALVAWASQEIISRKKYLATLFSNIRLPLLSPQFIADHVATNVFFKEDSVCQELIMDALKYHLLPERRLSLQSSRTKPRKSTVGLLYAVGGMDCTKGAISIEKYDLRSNQWSQVANMNGRRLQFGIAVLDGLLYVVGGRDGLKTLNTVECFDPKKKIWTMMTPMSTRRHGLGVGVMEGPMYAVGGHDGWSYLNTVERWDPQAKQWSFVAPLSTARSTVGVAVVGFKLYAVGGRDGSSCLRTVECYDPHTNKWSLCSPMTKRRGGVGVAVCNGFLYAVGGHEAPASNPASSRFDCVERYDCKTDTWTMVSPISSPRDAVGVSVLGDRLYAVGGYDGQHYLNEVECYDAQNNEWTKVAPLCAGRAGACVVHVSQ